MSNGYYEENKPTKKAPHACKMGEGDIMNSKKEWYSNCLIEAIKAKIKWGKEVKIIHIPARKNENYCPHFMWYDTLDGNIKDFTAGHGYTEKWWNFFIFKGHIRVRPYAVYERWLKTNKW